MYKSLLFLFLCLFSLHNALSQPCEITAVQATPLSCTGNNFMVSINLEINNPSSLSFTLAGNGTIYGTYLYADLPVTVGPFLGDDETVLNFIAWDIEDADCQNATTLTASNCGPICGFSNADLDFVSCITSNIALVDFDFDHQNTTNVAFDLFYENGTPVDNGTWLYASLPITINNFVVNGASPITLKICDHGSSSCCQFFTFEAIDCNPNNCEIFNVVGDPDCINNNFFLYHLDFEIDNPASDSFKLHGNSLDYGTFAYSSLPITLGPLNGNSNINWEFIIEDKQNAACSYTQHLGIYHCPPPCSFDSFDANALLCNGDDYYMLSLGMEIEGQGNTGFSVFSPDMYYGSHNYNELPLIIESFEGSGQFVDQITVCDNQHPQCCATSVFEALLCADCIIYNMYAFPLPCNEENEFMVELNFNYWNNGAQFEITGNGNNYGTFAYADLPIHLGPFDGTDPISLDFVATDLDDPICFDAIEIGPITCENICQLFNLTVETGECSGPDTYVAQINFDHEGMAGIGFDLYINGSFYHFYSYNDLPLTLEHFPSNGTGEDMVTVCANDNPYCCASLEFAAPDCACQLYDAAVTNLVCTSDSTFAILLNFMSENVPNHFIDVYLDDVYLGFYNAQNLPVIIPNIPEGDGEGILRVCASDHDDCCVEVELNLLQCDGAECLIWDLAAEHGDCTSDSTYLLDFSFQYLNFPSDSITVTANGEAIGTYKIQPVFNRIEQFPSLDNDTVHLVVCALGSPDCCEDVTYIAPDCSLFGHCQIWDLHGFVGDCQTDSTFVLHIEFNYNNLPVDSVHITANGEFFGDFQVHEGNIFLQHFPIDSGETSIVTVCALGDEECCDVFEFETPSCIGTTDCHIWDLHAIVGDCQSDSTYILHLEFNFDHLPTDSVVVTANGSAIGQYQVQDGNFYIEDFPVVMAGETVITVCALGAPDCCDMFEFQTPDCTGGAECRIWDLEGIIGDCQSDSTYLLHVEFHYEHLPTDSVTIYANGNSFGNFQVHEGSIFIEHFPVYETNHTLLVVCALGNADCCDTLEFETPDCEGVNDCRIWDLEAIIGDCQTDSTYILHVEFHYEHLGTDSVTILANGNSFGNFQVHEGSIFLEQFPTYETNHTLLIVCALGNADCCDTLEFETPDCEGGGTCHIFDLVADPGDCTSDSTYNLFIHYFTNNFPGDSVLITANDVTIGTFVNSPNGFTIENFPRFPGELTHLHVCAVEAPDCCDTYTFETPFCTDECIIYDINVQTFGCTSDSTFAAVIHFQYQNIENGGFDVYAGDQYLGFYTFEQVPIETGQFPSNETGHYFVTICENDNAECCATEDFNGPACGEDGCHIYDLVWEMTECDSNGLFYFILNFQYEHVGLDGFNIFGNGNNYGNFDYTDLPIQLGPFEANATNYEFLVSDDAFPDCFDVVNPGMVDCVVATDPVLPEDYFDIFNNGTLPGLLARKNVAITLYNINGKMILPRFQLAQNAYYEFSRVPDGFYILEVREGSHRWPVKLIKTGM